MACCARQKEASMPAFHQAWLFSCQSLRLLRLVHSRLRCVMCLAGLVACVVYRQRLLCCNVHQPAIERACMQGRWHPTCGGKQVLGPLALALDCLHDMHLRPNIRAFDLFSYYCSDAWEGCRCLQCTGRGLLCSAAYTCGIGSVAVVRKFSGCVHGCSYVEEVGRFCLAYLSELMSLSQLSFGCRFSTARSLDFAIFCEAATLHEPYWSWQVSICAW